MRSLAITTGVRAAIGPIHSSATAFELGIDRLGGELQPGGVVERLDQAVEHVRVELEAVGPRSIATASPPARATSRDRGTSTIRARSSVVSAAATHSGHLDPVAEPAVERAEDHDEHRREQQSAGGSSPSLAARAGRRPATRPEEHSERNRVVSWGACRSAVRGATDAEGRSADDASARRRTSVPPSIDIRPAARCASRDGGCRPRPRHPVRSPVPPQATLPMLRPPDVSLVVPVRDEAGNIGPLIAEIRAVLDAAGPALGTVRRRRRLPRCVVGRDRRRGGGRTNACRACGTTAGSASRPP